MRRGIEPDRAVLAVLPTGKVMFDQTLGPLLSTPAFAGGDFELWIVPGRPQDTKVTPPKHELPVVVVSLTPTQLAHVIAPLLDAILGEAPDPRVGEAER